MLPGRVAAMIPAGTAISIATVSAPAISDRLTGTRSAIAESTGWPLKIDWPRSPVNSPSMKCQYRVHRGSSSPSRRRASATSAAEAISPPAARRAGSPGAISSRKKTTSVTMTRIGTLIRRRLASSLSIGHRPFVMVGLIIGR